MQAHFPNATATNHKLPYNSVMGKSSTKPKPKQGARLAALRKAASLSQYELARLIGVPQPNIAFWEQSEKPPRSEVLPKMAEVLGVSVEDLLHTSSTTTKRQGGPTGKVRELFERVSKLPRRQQDKIVEFVAAFVNQYEEQRESK